MKYRFRSVFILICLTGIYSISKAQVADTLKAGFLNPPASAHPRTWWHWTKSNISKEGITKDLEWMKRIGIAGMQLADVNSGGGQTTPIKLEFGSPQWLDAVHLQLMRQNGLNSKWRYSVRPAGALPAEPG